MRLESVDGVEGGGWCGDGGVVARKEEGGSRVKEGGAGEDETRKIVGSVRCV